MTCPSCQRAPMLNHPGGVLEFRHRSATCTLLPAEDATKENDYARYRSERWPFTRPATDTERTLLTALGYALPDALTTEVSHLVPGVRRRTWDLPEPVQT